MIKYWLSQKSYPPFFAYSKNELLAKKLMTRAGGNDSRWDFNNLQVYDQENVVFGSSSSILIKTKRLSQEEQDRYWDLYLDAKSRWNVPEVTNKWKYSSGALISKDIINVHRPGTIAFVSKIVHGEIVPAVWLYDEWHESHGNDKLKRKGDHYFEIDLMESGPSRDQRSKCVFFSSHVGADRASCISDRKILKGDYGKKKNWFQLEWDGFGGFLWKVNGVNVFENHITLHEDVMPKLRITLGVTEPYSCDEREWKVSGLYHHMY